MAMKIYRKELKSMNLMNKTLWDLPTPSNISYMWNLGATLGLNYVIQIITGLILSMQYTSYSSESFNSLMLIMKDVWSGWLIRFLHMNGASVFFILIYIHIGRGLYYASYRNSMIWLSGMVVYFVLMKVAFLGYVLPWGQMSYWGVSVITNLMTVIPVVGKDLLMWIWGGYSVSSPTLTRFYSLHFLTPFILMFVILIHLMTLHSTGSSNPLGMKSDMDKVTFHPYYTTKDFYFFTIFFSMAFLVTFYEPYFFNDSLNNIPANPTKTPLHIQPEWYFLWSYAILRSIPSKTAGVMALSLSMSINFLLPLFKFKFSTKFNHIRSMMFFCLITTFILLTKLGATPASSPYPEMGLLITPLYMMFLMLICM